MLGHTTHQFKKRRDQVLSIKNFRAQGAHAHGHIVAQKAFSHRRCELRLRVHDKNSRGMWMWHPENHQTAPPNLEPQMSRMSHPNIGTDGRCYWDGLVTINAFTFIWSLHSKRSAVQCFNPNRTRNHWTHVQQHCQQHSDKPPFGCLHGRHDHENGPWRRQGRFDWKFTRILTPWRNKMLKSPYNSGGGEGCPF